MTEVKRISKRGGEKQKREKGKQEAYEGQIQAEARVPELEMIRIKTENGRETPEGQVNNTHTHIATVQLHSIH